MHDYLRTLLKQQMENEVAEKCMHFLHQHNDSICCMKSIYFTAVYLWIFYCSRYSPFLVACFNPETEEYQSVCRVMSGFSDSFYIEV